MDRRAAARAAELLLAARRTGPPLESLPDDCRPATAAEGYEIQDHVCARLGLTPSGYKVGATSETAQRFLGVDAPFAGRLFAETSHVTPADLAARDYLFRLIEPEFALLLGGDLPAAAAPYDASAVAGAVASVHPAIEVVCSAFGAEGWRHVGAAELIADNGAHGAFVLGPPCADWQGVDLAGQVVRLHVDGALAGDGTGANALGGPLRVLAWLANHLAGRGRALKAGDVVTTGVITPLVQLQAGQAAQAEFGPVGEVRVRFD